MKIQKSETIQSYFTRVAQIKEQLEVVREKVEEGEIIMTTLNGLPRSGDSFIQGISVRKKLIMGLTRKDIMLTLLKMMNKQGKEPKKKELILQVMKNMS